MDRRSFATAGLALASGSLCAGAISSDASRQSPTKKPSIRYCLNTSTIRGQNLGIEEEVRIAAEAGYSGIEPWIGKIREYLDRGGKTRDLSALIQDSGLTIESAIGFANWIVDDEAKRQKGLDDARRDMELIASLGGQRIAAPPAGTNDSVDLLKAAERYRKLLELGTEVGVTPQLELWGHSQPINRLGELLFVATEAAHPDACWLPDVYHIFKGGSDFQGLAMFNAEKIHVFHMNDYPAVPARDKMSDADRVYPGDGVAPLDFILASLTGNGFRGALSLELFNRELWKQDPLDVAKTGLRKMKECVASAGVE